LNKAMVCKVKKNLTSAQLRLLQEFGRRIAAFGANFVVHDADCEPVLSCESGSFQSRPEQLAEFTRQALDENERALRSEEAGVPVWRFGDSNLVLAAVLKSAPAHKKLARAVAVALIDMGSMSVSSDQEQSGIAGRISGAQAGSDYLMEILRLLAEQFRMSLEADQQIEMIGTELAQTYEELVLLHKLSTNMRVTEQDASFLQMACDNLTEIVLVEGIAILLEKTIDDEQQLVVAAGSGLIDLDERTSAVLHSRLMEQINSGKEALLDSEVDSPFNYDWPENIRNIIAVPLCGKDKAESRFGSVTQNGMCTIGLMVAVNRLDKQDFDSIDVKLFNSVASTCAVFIENGRLFKDLKELFIGSLKALTNSIDAKDREGRADFPMDCRTPR
jgi:GAF domain-containing protein